MGERLCLDFLNTANWDKMGEVKSEKLEDIEDVARWCQAKGLSDRFPLNTGSLESLQKFRGSLRRIFYSLVEQSELDREDLKMLNEVRSIQPNQILRIYDDKVGFDPAVSLRQIVLFSAIPILTSKEESERIKICPGDDCGWMFLDESKNRRRRWCSMELCGNREKARRHYKRKIAKKS